MNKRFFLTRMFLWHVIQLPYYYNNTYDYPVPSELIPLKFHSIPLKPSVRSNHSSTLHID